MLFGMYSNLNYLVTIQTNKHERQSTFCDCQIRNVQMHIFRRMSLTSESLLHQINVRHRKRCSCCWKHFSLNLCDHLSQPGSLPVKSLALFNLSVSRVFWGRSVAQPTVCRPCLWNCPETAKFTITTSPVMKQTKWLTVQLMWECCMLFLVSVS